MSLTFSLLSQVSDSGPHVLLVYMARSNSLSVLLYGNSSWNLYKILMQKFISTVKNIYFALEVSSSFDLQPLSVKF